MTLTSTASQDTKPAVLLNRYPAFDSAGNKLQQIRLRFICGHEEEFFSLALGKGWRARTDRQLKADYLQITCPTGWKVCSLCAGMGADGLVLERLPSGEYAWLKPATEPVVVA